MSTIRKTIAAGLAVTALSLSIAATSTPAAAWGGGWKGGGGGGGGWGGGWKGGGGWGWGAGGVAAGLALGAAAAAATPYYAPACYFTSQPVVDVYGNVVGYRRVRVCN